MAEFKNDYMTPEEREAYSRKLQDFAAESSRQRWQDSKEAQLCEQLYRAYTEYKEYLEANPRARRDANDIDTIGQQLYRRLRQNLDKANQGERCSHIKANGRRCGSPSMKEGKLCYTHARIAESRPKALDLPSLEDPNGVQLAIMKLAQLLIDDQVDAKKAGTIAYLIQTAANNVGRVHFEEEDSAPEG